MTEGPFGLRPTPPEEPRPPAPQPPPPPARIASNTAWIVGVLAIVIFAYITLNSIRTENVRPVAGGKQLPPFAVPLAVSDLEGDANVARAATDDVPRACDVRGPRVLNSCQLAERGPVVIVFFAEPSGACKRQVDVIDDLAARHPEIGFAAVSIRGNRDKVRDAVRERGWRIPVGFDRDGAVANAYGVAICPMITFARKGGRVSSTALKFLGAGELERRLRGL